MNKTISDDACGRLCQDIVKMSEYEGRKKNGKDIFSIFVASKQLKFRSTMTLYRFECHFISNAFTAHKTHSFGFCSLVPALRLPEYFYSIDRMSADRSTWHFCAFCGNLITIHYQLSPYHQVFTCAANRNVIWYFQEDSLFFSLVQYFCLTLRCRFDCVILHQRWYVVWHRAEQGREINENITSINKHMCGLFGLMRIMPLFELLFNFTLYFCYCLMQNGDSLNIKQFWLSSLMQKCEINQIFDVKRIKLTKLWCCICSSQLIRVRFLFKILFIN